MSSAIHIYEVMGNSFKLISNKIDWTLAKSQGYNIDCSECTPFEIVANDSVAFISAKRFQKIFVIDIKNPNNQKFITAELKGYKYLTEPESTKRIL